MCLALQVENENTTKPWTRAFIGGSEKRSNKWKYKCWSNLCWKVYRDSETFGEVNERLKPFKTQSWIDALTHFLKQGKSLSHLKCVGLRRGVMSAYQGSEDVPAGNAFTHELANTPSRWASPGSHSINPCLGGMFFLSWGLADFHLTGVYVRWWKHWEEGGEHGLKGEKKNEFVKWKVSMGVKQTDHVGRNHR